MDPAALRHRIELRRALFDDAKPWDDASGEEIIATPWAAILSQSLSEETEAEQHRAAEHLQFVIRHRTDLSGAITIHHKGKVYDLISVADPDLRGRWSLLEAKKKVGS